MAWYGRLVGDITNLTPTYPIIIAPILKVPVLGLYGGKDTGIPLETVEVMRNRLSSSTIIDRSNSRNKSEIIVYPDAPHAFFADYRPSPPPKRSTT